MFGPNFSVADSRLSLLLLSWHVTCGTAFCLAEDKDSTTAATPDDVLIWCRHIEVEQGSAQEYREAVATKTRLFNASPDASQWFTFRILTGPRANQFVRGFETTNAGLTQPRHPIQGLNPDWDDPEWAYWRENITPLEVSSGNVQVWQPISKLHYRGLAGSLPKYIRHRRWKMKPGMYQRLEAHYQQLLQTLESTGARINFTIGRLVDGGDFMTYSESTAFQESADDPTVGHVREAFIKCHGEGSWEKWLEEHHAVMQENAVVETELWALEESMTSSTLASRSDPKAMQLIESEIDVFKKIWKTKSAAQLAAEFTKNGVRALSNFELPVKGQQAIQESFASAFAPDGRAAGTTLDADVRHARFLTDRHILACGTWRVVETDGTLRRSGKWGNIWVVDADHRDCKMMLESAYMNLGLHDVAERDLTARSTKLPAAPQIRDVQLVKMIERSIERYASGMLQGDPEKVANEFREDGIRIVSEMPDLYFGRKSILSSLQVAIGDGSPYSETQLRAVVLGAQKISPDIVIANGVWQALDANNQLIDFGQWGNVLQIEDGEAKLLMESAGSFQE